MAANRTEQRLSSPQIVGLAAAISVDKMAAIAEGYMDISSETIENLKFKNKDDADGFNREIIRCWAYKNPANQVEVMITKFTMRSHISGGRGMGGGVLDSSLSSLSNQTGIF